MPRAKHEQRRFEKKDGSPQLNKKDLLPSHIAQGASIPRWKPRILRWPYLTLLFFVTVALTALLEIAVHRLPAADSKLVLSPWQASGSASSSAQKRSPQTPGLVVAQSYTTCNRDVTTSHTTKTLTTTVEVILASSSTSHETPSSLYTTSAPTESEHWPSTSLGTTVAAPIDNIVDPTIISAAISGSWVQATPQTSVAVAPIAADSQLVSDVYTAPPATPTHLAVPESSRASPETPLEAPYTVTNAPAAVTMLPPVADPTPTQPSPSSSTPEPSASSDAKDASSTHGARLISSEPSTANIHTAAVTQSTKTLTYYPLVNSQNPKYNCSLYPSDHEPPGDVATHYAAVSIYPWWGSFLSAILPVLITALYKNVWTNVYTAVKLMDPFWLLLQPGGALVKDTLFRYYNSAASLTSINRQVRGHWLLIFAAIVYEISGLFAPLASEVLLTSTHDCPEASTNGNHEANPCLGQLMVDVKAVRALQALLIVAAVITVAMGLLLRKRKVTGLYNDPSSIAGVASLTHHPVVVDDFLQLDPMASDWEAGKKLSDKRYMLGTYKTRTGSSSYGFVPLGNMAREYELFTGHNLRPTKARSPLKSEFGDLSRTSSADQHQRLIELSRKIRPRLRLSEMIFGLVILALWAIIFTNVRNHQEASDTRFHHFFSSQGFGPRFILVLVGSIIAAMWKSVYADISGKAIYAALAKGGVDAEHSICVMRPASPLSGLLPAISGRRIFEVAIAITAILADVLIVALPGVPLTGGERLRQFYICSYLSLTVLSIMIIMILALMVWRLKCCPTMPRCETQLQGAMSYVAGSGLIKDCEGLGMASTKERDAALQGMEKKYKYEKREDLGGRWTIDEDTGERQLKRRSIYGIAI